MADRDQVLSGLADQGGDAPSGKPDFRESQGESWQVFRVAFEALGGRILNQREFSEILSKTKWVDANVGRGMESDAIDVWSAEVGVSRATCAIAETASFLFASSSGSGRLTTLAPPICLVLIRHDAIVRTLSEALDICAGMPDRNLVLVTGPSRTSDIEGIMVRGVHGPREIYAYIEAEPEPLT